MGLELGFGKYLEDSRAELCSKSRSAQDDRPSFTPPRTCPPAWRTTSIVPSTGADDR